MSRILKRPMFRKGGSTSKGIMTGLVDRKKYQFGNSPFKEERTRADVEAITSAMDEYAPVPKTRLPIGEFGLNLASGMSITDALRGPYERFTKTDDARRAVLGKRKAAAVSTSLNQQIAERNALKKALADLAKENKKDKQELIKQETDLLKVYKNDKSVQNFAESSVQLKKMLSALEQDTGAGDVAAIFAFMKTLDPNSVVRESEFEVAEGTGGAKLLSFEKAFQLWQKLRTGQRLTEREKNNFKRAAIGFYQADQSSIDNIRTSFNNIIKSRNLDKKNIFIDNDIRPFEIETTVKTPGAIVSDGTAKDDMGGISTEEKFEVPPGTKLVDYFEGFYYFELPDGRRFKSKGLK